MPPGKHAYICLLCLFAVAARSSTGSKKSTGNGMQTYKEEHLSIEKALKMREDDDKQSYISRVQQIFCPLIDMCDFYSQEYSEEIPSFLEPIMFCESFCQSCQCDDDCVNYGDCCPDYDNSALIFSSSKSQLTCLPLSLNQSSDMPSISSYQKAYMMHATCPQNFPDKNVVAKCEKVTWESHYFVERTPVTANKTTTFKNKFCAICNGVENYSPWVINLVCDKQFYIPSRLGYELLLDMMWGEPGCNFILSMPLHWNSLELRPCMPYDERELISECNITGKWKNYNKNIDDSCHAYTLVFNKTYRNIFCFICNAEDYVLPCEKMTESEIGGLISISTIINSTGGDESKALQSGTCGRGFIVDSNKECREIHCPLGKWLRNGRCVTMVKLWKTPRYNFLSIYNVVPNITVQSCSDVFPNGISYLAEGLDFILLPESLKGKLYNDQLVIDGLVEYTQAECPNDSPNLYKRTLHKVEIKGKFSLLGHHDLDRSDIEEGLFQMSLSSFIFELPRYGRVKLEPDINSTYVARHSPSLDKYIPGVTLRAENLVNSNISSELPKFEFNVTRLLYCPYVILHLSECEFRDSNRKLYVPEIDSEFLYIDFAVVDNYYVHICADVFRTYSKASCDKAVYWLIVSMLLVHCFKLI